MVHYGLQARPKPFTPDASHEGDGQNHADDGTPIHVLWKLTGHASITTTRKFCLWVGDAGERGTTGRYGRLPAGGDSGLDSGDETDARMTSDGLAR